MNNWVSFFRNYVTFFAFLKLSFYIMRLQHFFFGEISSHRRKARKEMSFAFSTSFQQRRGRNTWKSFCSSFCCSHETLKLFFQPPPHHNEQSFLGSKPLLFSSCLCCIIKIHRSKKISDCPRCEKFFWKRIMIIIIVEYVYYGA